jgi:hypothetical protein
MGLTLAVLLATSFVNIVSFDQFDRSRPELCVTRSSVLATLVVVTRGSDNVGSTAGTGLQRHLNFGPMLHDCVQFVRYSWLGQLLAMRCPCQESFDAAKQCQ